MAELVFGGGDLKILVCIKQVVDSGEALAIDHQTGRVTFPPDAAFRMNRFDEFAMEEALRIKEGVPGSSVDAISVGPERVRSALERALGMGADHAIHVLDSFQGYVSPFHVASLIAACARDRPYALILAGAMAEDTMAGQTGQLVAALLDLPCATSVIKQEVQGRDGRVLVDREIEGGDRQTMVLETPAVLSIQPGIHLPRYPSFSRVMRARSYAQEVIDSESLGVPEEREICRRIRIPEPSSQGVMLRGTSLEKARELVRILHERSLLT